MLEPFAWRFVQAGFAILAFDYRCFGGSGGLPRHWMDPSRHREDYKAAVAFIRGPLASSGIADPERIALWGSSFSGGTVLLAASRDPEIRAVVAQCPYLQTPPELEPKGLGLLRFVAAATLDMLGLFPPVYLPLYGRPGERAFALSLENPSMHDFHGTDGSDFWRALPRNLRGGGPTKSWLEAW